MVATPCSRHKCREQKETAHLLHISYSFLKAMVSLAAERSRAETKGGNQMAEYKVIIEGRFPSLNEFIEANRAHKQKGNKMKSDDQNIISTYLLQQHRKLNIDKPVTLHYTFYELNKRRDLDNISSYFHKVFQDALVMCGIIHNDSWQYITGFTDTFYVDSKRPRIEIVIKETGREDNAGRMD